jgi:hypothetical protein
VIRKVMVHRLKLGRASSSDLTRLADTGAHLRSPEMPQLYLQLLREVGGPIVVKGERGYRVRAELQNGVSPFGILYTVPEFLDQISGSVDPKSPSLLSIPNVDRTSGQKTYRFVLTDSFVNLLTSSIQIAVNATMIEFYFIVCWPS